MAPVIRYCRQNLIEYGLCESDSWSFVFNKHLWYAVLFVIQDGVTATGVVIVSGHTYAYFVGHQTGRVGLMVNEVVYEMLAYPFFRR